MTSQDLYYIYILRCDDHSLYTGITNNLEKRMYEHIHQTKEAAAYTKSHTVTALEGLWSAKDRSIASKVEYRIKRLSKAKKEALLLDPHQLEDASAHIIEDQHFKDIMNKKMT